MKTTRLSPGSFSQQFKENFANLSLFFLSPKKNNVCCFSTTLPCSFHIPVSKQNCSFFLALQTPSGLPPKFKAEFQLVVFSDWRD